MHRSRKQSRAGLLVLGICLALMWMPGPIYAAPALQGDDLVRQGDELYAKGLRLFQSGQYQAALVEFEAALPFYEQARDRYKQALCWMSIGFAWQELDDGGRALEALQTSRSIWQEIDDRKGEAYALTGIGQVHASAARHRDALDAYQRALDIFVDTGNQQREAETRSSIAQAHRSLGQYEQALRAFDQALDIFDQLGDRAQQAKMLYGSGVICKDLGRYPEALERLEQAHALFARLKDRAGQGGALCGIGEVYWHQGRYLEGHQAFQDALALGRQIDNPALLGDALAGIGVIHRALGQYDAALAAYDEALQIARQHGFLREQGIALNNIGAVHEKTGQYRQALEHLEQALAIADQVQDYRLESGVLNNMGVVYEKLSRYQQALKTYQDALSIERQGDDQAAQVNTLGNIGNVYAKMGQYADALRVYEEALPISRATSQRAGEGRLLNNIGGIYRELEQYEQALDYLGQSLIIKRETGQKEGEAETLANIGSIYATLNQSQDALQHLEQGWSILREIGDREGEGTVANTIGAVYQSLGQYERALDYHQKGLAIAREIGDRAGESTALAGRGFAYEQIGDASQAIEAYQQAIEVIESIQAEIRVAALKTSYVAEQVPVYERLVQLLFEAGRLDQAFHYAERARARAFLDQLGNQRVDVRAGASAELLAQEEALRAKIAALETLLRQEWSKPQNQRSDEVITSVTTQLKDKRDEYRDLLVQLQIQNPEYASLVSVSPLTLQEVQALLDPQTTLVAYFVTAERTFSFVVTADKLEGFVLEISRQELAERVTYLRQIVPFRQPRTEQESAQALYDLLIKPLAPALPATARLGIVPHGVLHYLPFAALRNGDTFLLQERSLVFLPSASVLRFVLHEQASDNTTLLTLGNPTGDLPFAEQEAKAIADLYDVQPLLGSEATESQLRALGPDAGLVHIAAHGSFDPYNPLFSALYLAGDGVHDGRLQVHEVYGLNLRQADLVVLSACDTQLGELSAGDEIVGLNRAFIYAGTPSIVASLWPVDDAATAELMVLFYQRLQKGYGKAEALQAAQLELMTKHREAYYWAGFTLVGDWDGENRAPAIPPTAPTATATRTKELPPTLTLAGPESRTRCCSLAPLLVMGAVTIWLNRSLGQAGRP